MSGDNKHQKEVPTAPPSYSVLYPTGEPQPGAPQYGFQHSSVPQPNYFSQPYQPGYPPPQQPILMPPTSQTTVVTQPTVVVLGGCPSCRVGVLEEEYTCCGILCAICFFPLGIICCLAMKEKKCTNCNATY